MSRRQWLDHPKRTSPLRRRSSERLRAVAREVRASGELPFALAGVIVSVALLAAQLSPVGAAPIATLDAGNVESPSGGDVLVAPAPAASEAERDATSDGATSATSGASSAVTITMTGPSAPNAPAPRATTSPTTDPASAPLTSLLRDLPLATPTTTGITSVPGALGTGGL